MQRQKKVFGVDIGHSEPFTENKMINPYRG